MKSIQHIYFAWRLALVLCLSATLTACFNLTLVNPKAEITAAVKADTAPPEIRQALAPTGVLRVGVYPGSPTSWVKDPKTGESVGIALDLGKELAKRLNIAIANANKGD